MKKKTIPKILKQLVWNKYIGKEYGSFRCLCCNHNEIYQYSFHCGHFKSEYNGGETILENLRPICADCNLSMGKKNMDEFMQQYKLLNNNNINNIDDEYLYIKDLLNILNINRSNNYLYLKIIYKILSKVLNNEKSYELFSLFINKSKKYNDNECKIML
jgi:hypothetical protein